MRRIPVFYLCVAMLPSCNKPTSNTPPTETDRNFTHVESSDAAMNAAIATAKATSGKFLEALRNPKPSYRDFFVKKPYAAQDNAQEHMWIGDLCEVDGHLEGTIANEAYETKEVRYGQAVKVKLDEISDWKYLDGNRLIGGYTIRYFYDRMNKEDKSSFLRDVGFVLE